jgi:hypothetical protein
VSTKGERPTIPPAFDLAEFARKSEARLRAGGKLGSDVEESMVRRASEFREETEETRPGTMPSMQAVRDDEAWARSRRGVPALAIPASQVRQLPLDNKAGFLLSLMDGATDLNTLVEVSAMDRDEVLRILRDLHDSGVVSFQ